MKPKNNKQRIKETLLPLAVQAQVEFVRASFDTEPAGSYLRIYIDKPGGVDLNDCERFHRLAADPLDAFEFDFLEVCSLGLDRPIKTAKDLAWAKDQAVEARLYQPLNGEKTVRGILKDLDPDTVTLETPTGPMTLETKAVALLHRIIDVEEAIKNEDSLTKKEDA